MPVSSGAVLKLPPDSSIFILEDSEDRQKWFFQRVPDARFHSVVEETIEFLSTFSPDVCFLDCDLDWKESLPGRVQGGIRVAAFLARIGYTGRIVIHSVNEQGAQRMKDLLPHAEVHPFGTFEIEV